MKKRLRPIHHKRFLLGARTPVGLPPNTPIALRIDAQEA
jgi:hypothetical protein